MWSAQFEKESKMPDITLSCWCCGKSKHGQVEQLPTFSFEVVELAKQAGFIGVIDMENKRSIVFCSTSCADKCKKKNGSFKKKRPPQQVERR